MRASAKFLIRKLPLQVGEVQSGATTPKWPTSATTPFSFSMTALAYGRAQTSSHFGYTRLAYPSITTYSILNQSKRRVEVDH